MRKANNWRRTMESPYTTAPAGTSRFHPHFPPHVRSPKHHPLVVPMSDLFAVSVAAPIVHFLPAFFLVLVIRPLLEDHPRSPPTP
jgi:hypothetical protein